MSMIMEGKIKHWSAKLKSVLVLDIQSQTAHIQSQTAQYGLKLT